MNIKSLMFQYLPKQAEVVNYIKDNPISNDSIYIFVEGRTDELFYERFIKYIYRNYKVFFFDCENKEGVEKLFSRYTNLSKQHEDKYPKNRMLFFIDRDYDNGPKDKKLIPLEENLFITDYYNFESYLVHEDSIRFIIRKMLWVKDAHVKNFIIFYLDKYKVFKEFHTVVYLWIKKYAQDKSSGIKRNQIESLFELSKDFNILIKHYSNKDYKELFKILKETYNSNTVYSSQEFEQILLDKDAIDDITQKRFINGKTDLWFIVWLYTELKRKVNKLSDVAYEMGDLLLNHENVVYMLSAHIEIPKDIESFLELNYLKLFPQKSKQTIREQ